ncbi:MAG: Na+/H+ antiporter subunit D [Hydrogenophaga sp.]|uniref:Na+/H+ antiporter subunit D n=1 Tax=Hydrogenophaga sp. TaxID=1904254 RepID=UPI00258106D8|nr:Na+/H+ antiporter subunit D [Hydrogenophaga sp.]MBL0943380.1 Na+/H+ antiporter subunit D [Hydrogenophaga sp.]
MTPLSPHLLLTLPVAVPLATLALCALLHSRPRAQRAVSLLGSAGLLLASMLLLGAVFDGAVIATQFGDWAAPFGISFAADLLSAAMVVITGLMAVAVSVYALADGARERERAGFHPLYHGLLLGVTGAFLTGDLFNLYVWFEIMLIASFGLLVQGGTRAQLDAGVKYVVLNLLVTTLFLLGVGLLYGLTGTLNMADLARSLPQVQNQGLVATLAVLFLLAFGAKAAVFPLFFWLPAAYHTSSAPVVAIFAALLTKVGVYALLRCFTLVFAGVHGLIGPVVGVLAALTMVTGVLGAAAHYDVRRILSFHIVSQIGYMLVGLAVATPLAIAGAVLYVLHHIVVKANLFLIAGVLRVAGGSYDLKRIGGLHRSAPLLALLFVVPALSLAGLPPLSGFWAKFVVIRSSLEAGHVALAVTALAVGALTLYSMLKIWNEAFWKAPTALSQQAAGAWRARGRERVLLLAPVAALAGITLTIGLWSEPFVDFALRSADQLLGHEAYTQAVLGNAAPVTAPPAPPEELLP